MRGARRAPVAVAFSVAALLVVGCGERSARTALERAASSGDEPRFVFIDRPDAASLMECLGAAETLVVTVDTERNAMAVRREGELDPVVVWTAAASFVDASLLTSGRGWIRIERDLVDSIRSDVEAAVGASVSGYVFAERLAPSAAAVARSALAVAGDVVETRSSTDSVTVAVEVDGTVGGVAELDEGSIPSLSFTIVDGRIASIGARLPSDGEDSFGFVWDYDRRADVVPVEPPLTATDVAAIASTIGTGNRGEIGCALGL